MPKLKQEGHLFDSTVPHDKTWHNRAVQSISLRQKHHLNQSIKLRKNLAAGPVHGGKDVHFDIRAHIEADKHRSKSPALEDGPTIEKEEENIPSARLHVADTPDRNKPLSPITQEFSATPGGR
jgi:hypothetical protein